MATVELKAGEVIVTQEELNELFRQRDEAAEKHNRVVVDLDKANKTVQFQKVLINHCISLVEKAKKIFPGIAEGKLMQGFNPMMLMNNPDLDKLGGDFQKLNDLIIQYGATNPLIISDAKNK